MAIGWLTILKSVPWADVISNAPVVADGARKLWKAAAKKTSRSADDAAEAVPATASEQHNALDSRTALLEAAVSDLRNQMLASSELIKALAEQNAQLVQHIETNRVRMLWLSVITFALAVVATLALYFAFARL